MKKFYNTTMYLVSSNYIDFFPFTILFFKPAIFEKVFKTCQQFKLKYKSVKDIAKFSMKTLNTFHLQLLKKQYTH